MSIYWDRKKKNCEVLGSNICGFNVTPSPQAEFYGEYFYKIATKGNNISYDIEKHYLIDQHITKNYFWQTRTQFTSKARHIYFNKKHHVEDFLKTFPEVISEVVGPINEEHKDMLFDLDNKMVKVFREKLYYGKYDIKIEAFISYAEQKEKKGLMKDFMEFIDGHVDNKHWYTSNPTRCYHNYLYLTSDELAEVQPWINMLYRDLVDKIYRIENIDK